jgi:general secretion pathway protein A
MDRETTGGGQGLRPASGPARILPSRRAALDACRAALGAGPILLSGESGVGKTWLAARLAEESGPSPSWLTVDLTTATDPAGLLHLVGHALGLGAMSDRLVLGDFLAERAADGHRWGLVLDEVQCASTDVLEEVRVLSNRLGRPDGLAALVLVGQTALQRRLRLRSLAPLEARLAARVHLRPLDVDEAGMLLSAAGYAETAANPDRVDQLHRAAAGNPRRLVWLAPAENDARSPAPSGPPRPRHVEEARGIVATPSRLGADRPPLHVEDGLIEVGWEPDADPADDALSAGSGPDSDPVAVDDHYAALQAWNEWARNQGRESEATAVAEPPRDDEMAASEPAEPGPVADEEAMTTPTPNTYPNLRAEGQQGFAPYGQLFSRLRPARDSES